MTTSPMVSTTLAVLCVLAIGVSATTLESSMETDPDDVIDLDWERLPIGEATAAEMNEEIKENGELEEPDAGSEGEPDSPSDPGGESRDSGGVAERVERAVAESRDAGTRPDRDPFPWDLLWLLAAIGLSVALGVCGYRYWRRLHPGADSAGDGAEPPPWPPDGPMTEVDRAWYAMVRRLDLDRPWTRTPAELAEAAVDAGMDPEAVERVTSTFEDVRYGGAPVTSARRERARSGLRRLGVEPGGGPA